MSTIPPQGPNPGQPPRDPRTPNPFGDQVDAPFASQPLGSNPYAPGTTNAPAHDPALSLLAPINTSGWAIAAGYLGLVSPVFCFCGPFAILTGVLAWRDCKRNPQMAGKFRAVFGMVLGGIGTLLLLLFLIMAAAGGMN